jgi:hypothetical protein
MNLIRTNSAIPLALVGTLVLAACDSDSPSEPPTTPIPAEIQLDPEAVELSEVGATKQIVAVVLDEDGNEIESPELTWNSSDETVVIVNEDGVVEAVGEGTADVSAETGQITSSVAVSVEFEEEEDENGEDENGEEDEEDDDDEGDEEGEEETGDDED